MRNTDPIIGVNTFSVLQIIFIVLKLLNLIDWSWWVVFVPTWEMIAIALVILIAYKLIDR